MNPSANAFDPTATQSRPDGEPHLANREAERPAPYDTRYMQNEVPCSCPGCFPLWD